MTRTESVTTADDGEMESLVVLPETGSGPGLVLLHEIFGVNDYVREVARRLAGLGYVVLAPDLYWRTQPGLSLGHDEAGLSQGMAASRQMDKAAAAGDAVCALTSLRALAEVTGRSGVVGHCLGGALAFQVAIHADPDTAVCYYGAGIADALDAAEQISCPVLFHFGGRDAFIAREQIDRVAALAAAREDMECHVHEDAGHAFDNHEAPMFHHPAAAARAWEITSDFLARTLDR